MFRRLLAALLILAVAAVLLVTAWPQLFGLQRAIGVAQAVSLRGLGMAVAAALVLVLLILALIARPFRSLATSFVVLLLAFVAVNGVVLVSRGLGTAPSSSASSELTVLSWNTLGPATTPEQIADLALSQKADVVVLPETREQDAVATAVLMRASGSPMWVLTQAYDQISPARSTALLISVKLGEYQFDDSVKTTAVLPTVVATPVNGEGPTIVAVHAVAPMPDQMDNWRGDLEALAAVCSGGNIVMAGDFNATVDHFSGLGREGSTPNPDEPSARLGECTDAAAITNSAALGTWPTALPPLLGAPIDHVMIGDDWRVDGFELLDDHDDAGSDHRPIVARLSYAG